MEHGNRVRQGGRRSRRGRGVGVGVGVVLVGFEGVVGVGFDVWELAGGRMVVEVGAAGGRMVARNFRD